MSTAIQISGNFFEEAKISSKINNRSITSQILYWLKIGKIAEENPDLTFEDIQKILIGLEELNEGLKTEYQFG